MLLLFSRASVRAHNTPPCPLPSPCSQEGGQACRSPGVILCSLFGLTPKFLLWQKIWILRRFKYLTIPSCHQPLRWGLPCLFASLCVRISEYHLLGGIRWTGTEGVLCLPGSSSRTVTCPAINWQDEAGNGSMNVSHPLALWKAKEGGVRMEKLRRLPG